MVTTEEDAGLYCVIQEIDIKKVPSGEAKAIEVCETTWTINGVNGSTWGWRYSDEHFNRSVRKAYRISIHESYREAEKVKKKQTVICTIGYYDIVDWGGWIGGYITGSRWKDKVKVIGLPEALKKIKADYRARKEYERRSQEQSRSYYEDFYSNYGGTGDRCGSVSHTNSQDNKTMLKKFYQRL